MGAVKHAVSLKVAGAAEANATHTGRPSTGVAAAAAASCSGVSKGCAAGAVVGVDAAQAGG